MPCVRSYQVPPEARRRAVAADRHGLKLASQLHSTTGDAATAHTLPHPPQPHHHSNTSITCCACARLALPQMLVWVQVLPTPHPVCCPPRSACRPRPLSNQAHDSPARQPGTARRWCGCRMKALSRRCLGASRTSATRAMCALVPLSTREGSGAASTRTCSRMCGGGCMWNDLYMFVGTGRAGMTHVQRGVWGHGNVGCCYVCGELADVMAGSVQCAALHASRAWRCSCAYIIIHHHHQPCSSCPSASAAPNHGNITTHPLQHNPPPASPTNQPPTFSRILL